MFESTRSITRGKESVDPVRGDRLSVEIALCVGLLIFASQASAGDLSIPNTFVGGETALADEVNANFTAVEVEVDDNDSRIDTNGTAIGTNAGNIGTNAGNISANAGNISANAGNISGNAFDITANGTAINGVRTILAQATDSSAGGVTRRDATDFVVSSLNLTVPNLSGRLFISATVFINNQTDIAGDFQAKILLDGNPTVGPTFDGFISLGENGNDDLGSLSFSKTITISAGAHTVAVRVDPGQIDEWFYNAHNLSVLYVPSPVVLVSASTGEEPEVEIDETVDEYGFPIDEN